MFFWISMQTISRFNPRSIFLSALLFFITLVIIVHKIDTLRILHIFSSLKIFYALFSITAGYIFFYCYHTLHKKILRFFAITAPSVFAFCIAFSITGTIHYIFYLFVGLWFISLIGYLLYQIDTHRTITPDIDIPSQQHAEKIWTPFNITFLLTVVLCFIFFGLFHLDKGSFVDEKLWTYGVEQRIEKYYPNILQRDWKNTRPSDKPGVTLAMISGIGLLWTTPSDFYHNFDNGPKLAQMLYIMRLPTLIFCGIMITLFFMLIHKLFGQKTAVLATLMIGSSPILIGISRLINPDALSWVFMPLTFLCYFLYLKKRTRLWLYSTGILLGLSLLTKYIANLFIVFFILEIFSGFLFSKDTIDVYTYLRNKIIDIGIILFLALTTFYILFPGTWLIPDRLLLATIWSEAFLPVWKPFLGFCAIFLADHFFLRSQIFIQIITTCKKYRVFFFYTISTIFLIIMITVIANASMHMLLTNFERLLAAPKSTSQFSIIAVFSSGFYAMIYSISPIVLVGVFCAIIASFDRTIREFDRTFLWHTILFIIIFYAGSAISLIAATIRYQIILYPLFFIIAAYGWHYLWTKLKFSALFIIVMLLFAATSLYTLWTVKPFYFSYTSMLLPNAYIVNPKDMGDGSYEISEYLNTLPHARDLKIWSDKNGVCVFFVGYCNSRVHLNEFDENGTDYDYYVISRGSEYGTKRITEQRLETDPSYPLRLDRLYDYPNIIYEISPGNRRANYIRIISGNDLVVLDTNNASQ